MKHKGNTLHIVKSIFVFHISMLMAFVMILQLNQTKAMAKEETPYGSEDEIANEKNSEYVSEALAPQMAGTVMESSPELLGDEFGTGSLNCTLNKTLTGSIPAGEEGVWCSLILDKSYMLQLTHSNDTFIYKHDKSGSLWDAWGIDKTEYGCLLKGTYYVWVKNTDKFNGENNPFSLTFRSIDTTSNFQSSEEDYDDSATSNDVKGKASEYLYSEGFDEFTIHGLCGYNNNVDWYHFQFLTPVKITLEYTNYTYTKKEEKNTSYMPKFTLYDGNKEIFHTISTFPKISSSLMGMDYYICVEKYNYANNKSNFHSYEIKISPADKTVSYDANGGNGTLPVDSGKYSSGDIIKVKSASDLQRTGYRFKGWSTTADGSEPIFMPKADFTIGQSSIVFYAVWEKASHVTYDGNGATSGLGPEDTKDYYDGDTVKVKAESTLQRTGYRFKGWSKSEDGSIPIYKANDNFIIGQSDVIFYAVWEKASHVTYDGNGATGGLVPVDNKDYYEGDTVKVLGKDSVSRAGYRFLGWSDVSNATIAKYEENSTFVIADKDITLYAVWYEKVDDLSYKFPNPEQIIKKSLCKWLCKDGIGLAQDDQGKTRLYYKVLYNGFSSSSKYNTCRGVATTAGMLYFPNNDVNINDFNINASRIWDLSETDTHSEWKYTDTSIFDNKYLSIDDFIQCMFISQKTAVSLGLEKDVKLNSNSLNSFFEVIKYEIERDRPVVIGLNGEDPTYTHGQPDWGHSVLAYDYFETTNKKEIFIYDSNYPGQIRKMILSGGILEYTLSDQNWKVPLHWHSSDNNVKLSYLTYAAYMTIWDNRGRLWDEDKACISTKNKNIAISNANGTVAIVEGGV